MRSPTVNVVEDNRQPRSCTFCHDHIEPGMTAVACRACGAAYHKICWQTLGECAVLGCNSRHYRSLDLAPSAPSTAAMEPVAGPVVLDSPAITASAPASQVDEDMSDQITILSEEPAQSYPQESPVVENPSIITEDTVIIDEWELPSEMTGGRADVEGTQYEAGWRGSMSQLHANETSFLIKLGLLAFGVIVGLGLLAYFILLII